MSAETVTLADWKKEARYLRKQRDLWRTRFVIACCVFGGLVFAVLSYGIGVSAGRISADPSVRVASDWRKSSMGETAEEERSATVWFNGCSGGFNAVDPERGVARILSCAHGFSTLNAEYDCRNDRGQWFKARCIRKDERHDLAELICWSKYCPLAIPVADANFLPEEYSVCGYPGGVGPTRLSVLTDEKHRQLGHQDGDYRWVLTCADGGHCWYGSSGCPVYADGVQVGVQSHIDQNSGGNMFLCCSQRDLANFVRSSQLTGMQSGLLNLKQVCAKRQQRRARRLERRLQHLQQHVQQAPGAQQQPAGSQPPGAPPGPGAGGPLPAPEPDQPAAAPAPGSGHPAPQPSPVPAPLGPDLHGKLLDVLEAIDGLKRGQNAQGQNIGDIAGALQKFGPLGGQLGDLQAQLEALKSGQPQALQDLEGRVQKFIQSEIAAQRENILSDAKTTFAEQLKQYGLTDVPGALSETAAKVAQDALTQVKNDAVAAVQTEVKGAGVLSLTTLGGTVGLPLLGVAGVLALLWRRQGTAINLQAVTAQLLGHVAKNQNGTSDDGVGGSPPAPLAPPQQPSGSSDNVVNRLLDQIDKLTSKFSSAPPVSSQPVPGTGVFRGPVNTQSILKVPVADPTGDALAQAMANVLKRNPGLSLMDAIPAIQETAQTILNLQRPVQQPVASSFQIG